MNFEARITRYGVARRGKAGRGGARHFFTARRRRQEKTVQMEANDMTLIRMLIASGVLKGPYRHGRKWHEWKWLRW